MQVPPTMAERSSQRSELIANLGTHSARFTCMDTLSSGAFPADAARLAELAHAAARHATQLLGAEIALVKDELRSDLQNAKRRAVGLAISAMLLEAAIMLLAVGVILLLGVTAVVVFSTGIVLGVLSLVISLYGFRLSNHHTVAITRERLYSDAQSVVRSTNG